MQQFLVAAACAVLVVTVSLVRRLVAPVPRPSTGHLTVLAVAVSTSALVTAARGAQALAVGLAALGVAAIVVALLGTSQHLR